MGTGTPHRQFPGVSASLQQRLGIPGLALKADQTAAPGNGVKVQLGWQLHLVFGLGSLVTGAGLILYERYFLKKSKGVSYL